MALNTSRLPARARGGPQRPRGNGDENSANVVQSALNKHVRQPSAGGPMRVAAKTGPQRPILSEVTTTAVNKQAANTKAASKSAALKEDVTALKRGRSSSVSNTVSGPQRVPLGVKNGNRASATVAKNHVQPSVAPLRSQRPTTFLRQSETAPELTKIAPSITVQDLDEEEDDMDIEEVAEVKEEVVPVSSKTVVDEPEHDELDGDEEDEEREEDETERVPLAEIWPRITPRAAEKYRKEIEEIQASFKDEIDETETNLEHEYSEEIFNYMQKLELEYMPNPNYIEGQNEIDFGIRQELVDWMLMIHHRYRLLPETLWIAINIVDRFLSKRVVSIVKVQLVGLTALLIASKYEEILAPGVEEFGRQAEDQYSREEILKGEKIVLATLNFQISGYCNPYSWMRRISKADDYNIQTRTLCKFLVELTLLDYRFLRVKPSLVAAVGMYASRRMLGGNWDDAFTFYSGYTEDHLEHGYRLILEKLLEPEFAATAVFKKYTNKKFMQASVYALQFAHHQAAEGVESEGEDIFMDE